MYLLIGFGSALGGMARYGLSGLVARFGGEVFPLGTLAVNVLGSLAIGFVFTLTEPDGRLFIGSEGRQFMMFGIFGGFTTFSSFSLQTLNLFRDGDWVKALLNVALSVVLCLLAVWLGHLAAAAMNQMRGV